MAEEMRRAERGAEDLVLLRLGDAPYTQKPPLYFWLAAAGGELRSGVDAWSARLPSAIAALATLGVWVAIARRLFPGTAIAWTTAALLLTSFRFAHFARRAQLDVLLTLFESMTLAGFVLWHGAKTPRERRRALWLLHGATALALLTKGPVGLLPWVCFAAVLALEGRGREIRRCLPAWGIAVATTPVLAWVAASVALAPDGFFQVAVVENVWSRFATGTAHVRPIWYFVLQGPIEALPWSLLWPALLAHAWAVHRSTSPEHRARLGPADAFARRMLAAWVLIPFVFFSLSAGKRGIYLLPALPALCMAVAWTIERMRTRWSTAWLDGPLLPGLASAALGIAAAAAGTWRPEAVAESAAGGAAFDAARTCLFVIAAFGAALTLVCMRPPSRLGRSLSPGLASAWAIFVAAYAALFFAVLPRLEPEKSPRPIAHAVDAAAAPGEPVGLYRQRQLLGGLLFYGDGGGDGGSSGGAGGAPDISQAAGGFAERPIELLENRTDLDRFFDAGGRWVVVRSKRLGEIGPIRSRTERRSGRRAQSIVELGGPRPSEADADDVAGTDAASAAGLETP